MSWRLENGYSTAGAQPLHLKFGNYEESFISCFFFINEMKIFLTFASCLLSQTLFHLNVDI